MAISYHHNRCPLCEHVSMSDDELLGWKDSIVSLFLKLQEAEKLPALKITHEDHEEARRIIELLNTLEIPLATHLAARRRCLNTTKSG